MLKEVLKKRFKKSQSVPEVLNAKSWQKDDLLIEYKKAVLFKNKLESMKISSSYIDTYWNSICGSILNIYEDETSFSRFGQNELIIKTMIGDPVRNLQSKFDGLIDINEKELVLEEWFGNFRLNIPKLKTTAQRLSHIYIANLIQDILYNQNVSDVKINEIGGGFGGLASVLSRKMVIEKYQIIDLWQLLPLQRAYLNLSLGSAANKFSYIPVVDNFILNTSDIFISNWALTEATSSMQDYVVDNNFFGAKHIFIACQDNNDNHNDGRHLISYLSSQASLTIRLKGPLADSKLFYIQKG